MREWSSWIALTPLLCAQLLAQEPEFASFQEKASYLRIQDYWKEKDRKATRRELMHHLQQFQNPAYHSSLLALLGDLYLEEKEFEKAVESYQQVIDDKVVQHTLVNHLYALHQLRQHDAIIALAQSWNERKSTLSKDVADTMSFYHARSLYLTTIKSPVSEERSRSLEMASSLVESISTSALYRMSRPLQLKLYQELDRWPEAAELCSLLEEGDPNNRSFWAYQKACLQAKFSPDQAINSFLAQLTPENKRASDAAYNILAIVSQQKNFSALLPLRERLETYLDPSAEPLMALFVGEALLMEKEWDSARTSFEKSLGALETSEDKISAFQGLLQVAFQTDDLDQMETHLQELRQLTQLIPAKNYLMYVKLLEKKQDPRWEESLQCFLKTYPDHLAVENLQFQLGVVLESKQAAELAMTTFGSLLDKSLKQIPDDLIWPHWVKNAIGTFERLPVGTDKTSLGILIQNRLIGYLDTLPFDHPGYVDYLFLLIQVESELEATDMLSVHARKYLDQFPQGAHALPVYHMLSSALLRGKKDVDGFVDLQEKALLLSMSQEEQFNVHYQIFIALQEKLSREENILDLNRAISHLHQAYQLIPDRISPEEKWWMVQQWHALLLKKTDAELVAEVAPLLQIIEPLLIEFQTDPTLVHAKGYFSIALELYQKTGAHAAYLQTMENFYLLSSQVPNVSDHERQMMAFTLGERLKSLDPAKAHAYYEASLSTDAPLMEISGRVAALNLVKMDLQKLSDNQFDLDHPDVIRLLNSLKDLELTQLAEVDPTALEAAFLYAELRTKLMGPEEKRERATALWNQLQEKFFERIPSSAWGDKYQTLYQVALHSSAPDGMVVINPQMAQEWMAKLEISEEEKNVLPDFLVERVESTRKFLQTQLGTPQP